MSQVPYSFKDAPAMAVERLTDVIRVLQPKAHGCTEDVAVTGFSIDSRNVQPGEIYVAIQGQRVDGHQFCDEAMKRGAVACLVTHTEGIEQSKQCIVVEDSIRALGYLAACHRRAMKANVIGITGSVGKTTTKEILTAVLNTNWRTRKSQGNYNSTIGLPIELLKLRPDDAWMVAEMGMSTAGEIAQLVDIAKPQVALWTAVQPVHLANFENIDGIVNAKAELMEGLGEDGLLIFNADDPRVAKRCAAFAGRKFSYGILDARADVRARIEPFSDWDSTPFMVEFGKGKHQMLNLPMVGRFNVGNALAACAVGLALGVSGSDLVAALRYIKPSDQRCKLLAYTGDVLVVDDSYNANPYAVEQVLRSFAPLSPRYFRWLVLGDMLELGDEEEQIHLELGYRLAGYGFDRITLVGDLVERTYEGLKTRAADGVELEYFSSVNEAAAALNGPIPEGARIWCKASRGIRLERFVQALTAKLA
ncbi:UDP-N-acetylmuramoyl-tripeptide--D-alanyl-D-alanine ligase [Acanthopleuribacter pedis]|uniref:UDP-N-acetylmuramoyl-tripeptide--D-alanyl-D-alanine ligase n=1 Tax=Acanthopleuribacter pedis TaxID=442870 RepID=A0A8J7Q657_9BACT|nr:UDP-N-acetylmuramoyl-tripeptide--D-alanyl-D-alanine ligase [Acanthopleuribacter pedis]MBO1318751.1 UDP-N-acetylmuramoyl-tripeptide--D-alanyl-D-alanine ligase [Acanthopleuribacter pedis]